MTISILDRSGGVFFRQHDNNNIGQNRGVFSRQHDNNDIGQKRGACSQDMAITISGRIGVVFSKT